MFLTISPVRIVRWRLTLALLAGLLLLACGGTDASEAADRDPMEARVAPCVSCHGKEGRATNAGYFPRIAGKPAGYLYHQLANFRDGRRVQAQMNYLVANLSDDYLREIATYFSRLDLPYPPPQTTGAPSSMLERGKMLALHGDPARELPACAKCHGSALTGVAPSIPGLLGLPRDYINGQLGAWKTGQRHAAKPDCMAQVAQKLDPEDVSALSTWLSSQAVTDNARPAAALEHRLPLRCGDVDEPSA